MKLFLATKLSVEECKERLHNAIDPIPTTEERENKSPNTTSSPDPLSSAGRRVTGFGYSPGTRPVVGTIEGNTFNLEKLVVQTRDTSGPQTSLDIAPQCTGKFEAASYGTLIEVEMEEPSGNILLLFASGFFAILFVLASVVILFTYITGTQASRQDVFGSCCIILILGFPTVLSLVLHQTNKSDRQYLLKFLKVVCQAVSLKEEEARSKQGYTGKTQRL
jgi:hypothetical protein